ncbi:MAG: ABC transporter permease [Chloroflexi bacterium]|nr:ABC transporter permease [Chloroflexota bacterium]
MSAYVLSQFRGRPWRSLAVVAGIALGAALFVALSALGTGFRQAARLPLVGVSADVVVTRPAGAAESAASAQRTRGVRLPFGVTTLSTPEVEQMAHTAGVAGVAATLQVWDFGPTSYQTVLGLDLGQTSVGPATALSQGLLAGRLFRSGERGVAVADRHYAAFFSLKPGAMVTIGGKSFQLVGVAEQKGASQGAVPNLYVPLADAQMLAGLSPNQVDQVYLKVASAGDVETVVKEITRQVGQISAITEDSLLQVMGGIGQVSARFAQVAAALGLVGGLVLAWLAMGGLVNERRQEIGLMKAVGWRAGDVARVFLMEALALSVAGGLAGMALGWASAWVLGQIPIPQATTQLGVSLPGLAAAAPTASRLTLPAEAGLATLALALLAAVVGGTLAGWVGARRAAALKPAEALRDR